MKITAARLAMLGVLSVPLVACGSSDESDPTTQKTSAAPTGPLAGSENGLAQGSTTEVPFDASVASSGRQDSPTTPATVISEGITREGEEIEFAAEVTITGLVKLDIDDFDLDAKDLEIVGDTVPHYLAYTARYVNGPVASQPDLTTFDVVDDGGKSLGSRVRVTFPNVQAKECDGNFKTESFGEGAEIRGCALAFLKPGDPDAVTWTYQAASSAW
jgi:hypothetical protein